MMEIFINFIIRKELPIETVRIVESFYHDEYTRQMPGKKDFISIGRNIYIQKRLILCNLKELFTEFKTKFPKSRLEYLVNIISYLLYYTHVRGPVQKFSRTNVLLSIQFR